MESVKVKKSIWRIPNLDNHTFAAYVHYCLYVYLAL